MKICPRCKKSKEISFFGIDKKSLDGKQSYCYSCAREYAQKDYQKKRQYYFDKEKRNKEHYLRWGRTYIWEYLLLHPCIDCGESDPLILEFDHVRGIKDKAVLDMMASHVSKKRLLEEIDKCEIRCANCHRRKSAFQLGWWRDKWDQLPVHTP